MIFEAHFKKVTNFLKYCTGSADGMDSALGAGASGVVYASGVGKMYTWSKEDAAGSGLFLGWAMAPGYRFMGIG